MDEQLPKEAKGQAAKSGMTLQAMIEESLRERLARGKVGGRARQRVRLSTTGEGGLLPGIDLDDASSLLDAMDGTD